MNRTSDNHVFLLSYNRPGFLAQTLDALRIQTVADWNITLVQDGHRGEDEARTVDQCVGIFRDTFPRGDVLRQKSNVGVGLNVLRAQERAFGELGLEAAYFFEDDLVVHRTYLEQLMRLRGVLSPFRNYVPYFACYGNLHPFGPVSEQIPGTGLRFLDHALWAYGLFRDHWLEEQALLAPYFGYLRKVPYHRRDHGVVKRIFGQLGCRHPLTSQDGARILALRLLGRCAVTTLPRRATYIGEIGEHSNSSTFRRWGFFNDRLPPDIGIVTPAICQKAASDACAKFPEWVDEMSDLPPNRIAALEHAIALKDHRIARLDAMLAEKTFLLEATRKSTCWRATAPFRLVADKLRAARRRLFRRASAPLSFESGTVAIDISTLWHHDAGTGIQRVVRQLAVGLASSLRTGKRVLLVDYSSGVPLDVTAPFLGEEAVSLRPGQVTGMEMLVMLDSSYNLAPSFSRRLRQAKRDGVFIVSVCHDILPVTNPEWFLAVNHIPFRRWLKLAADYSNAFLCVSDTTADRLRVHLESSGRAPSPSVASWPLGHNLDAWVPPKAADAAEKEGFALMVGTVEPRKNHVFVLENLEKLRNEGIQTPKLVVVGRYGWKNKAAQRLLRNAVRAGWAEWHDQGISDDDLCNLYSCARCVIQASLDEGFGLPVAEAAAFGKPVVLGDIPVFREIVKESGYFFRQGDTGSFADALQAACRPGAKATTTKAVSWQESADIFWNKCLELQAADRARRAAGSVDAMD